ncbi:MAG: polysaccharide biosynthesis/export family protein, partial [Phycisphaerae bacterium]
MDSALRRQRRWRGAVRAAVRWAAVALCGASGCASDYRISFTEFLRLEQETREAQATTLSPAQLDALKTLIDRRLGPYNIGPSDILTVTITNGEIPSPHQPITVRVDQAGEIVFPLVGAVSVGGKTLEEAEDAVRQAFVPAVYKDAVAHVETTVPYYTNVFVRGAVTDPGLVPLRRTERNLLYAVVGAGGAAATASGKVTLLRVRRPNEKVTLDLTDPLELQAALALDPLETGDIIKVDAAFPNVVFIGGLVNAPRPLEYSPGVHLNILQAIAAAGGLRTDVWPTEATLVRRLPDGRDVHVKIELNALRNGADPNILLAAGDILWVPETIGTRIEDFINRNIFLRAGVSIN